MHDLGFNLPLLQYLFEDRTPDLTAFFSAFSAGDRDAGAAGRDLRGARRRHIAARDAAALRSQRDGRHRGLLLAPYLLVRFGLAGRKVPSLQEVRAA
jgi:hypothetical protein